MTRFLGRFLDPLRSHFCSDLEAKRISATFRDHVLDDVLDHVLDQLFFHFFLIFFRVLNHFLEHFLTRFLERFLGFREGQKVFSPRQYCRGLNIYLTPPCAISALSRCRDLNACRNPPFPMLRRLSGMHQPTSPNIGKGVSTIRSPGGISPPQASPTLISLTFDFDRSGKVITDQY